MGIHKPTTPAVSYPNFPNDVFDTENSYVANTVYPSFQGIDKNGALGNISANYLYAVPYIVRAPMSVDFLCLFNSSTGQSGNKFRLGLYASSTTAIGSLIVETGETTLDGSAALRTVAITQQNLSAGLYYLAVNCNAVVQSVHVASQGGVSSGNFGEIAWANGLSQMAYPTLYKAHTYGSLPDPYGSVTGAANGWVLGMKTV
tara:strand:+ start:162 stop:767 length:606 start_codon:yes stop_codon:yes gene_type:complete